MTVHITTILGVNLSGETRSQKEHVLEWKFILVPETEDGRPPEWPPTSKASRTDQESHEVARKIRLCSWTRKENVANKKVAKGTRFDQIKSVTELEECNI
jgi:hypothetical protein